MLLSKRHALSYYLFGLVMDFVGISTFGFGNIKGKVGIFDELVKVNTMIWEEANTNTGCYM